MQRTKFSFSWKFSYFWLLINSVTSTKVAYKVFTHTIVKSRRKFFNYIMAFAATSRNATKIEELWKNTIRISFFLMSRWSQPPRNFSLSLLLAISAKIIQQKISRSKISAAVSTDQFLFVKIWTSLTFCHGADRLPLQAINRYTAIRL